MCLLFWIPQTVHVAFNCIITHNFNDSVTVNLSSLVHEKYMLWEQAMGSHYAGGNVLWLRKRTRIYYEICTFKYINNHENGKDT